MNPVFILFSFFTIAVSFSYQPNTPEMAVKKYTYLAIGDSYTIGESVAPAENFPNQAVQLLQKENSVTIEARIIAKTGWTTDELEAGIIAADKEESLLPSYDFVSLLIGVNNQYRGRSVEEYKPEFEALLKKAIRFAGNNASHVVLLSIPDWGVTPFAEGRDRSQIAAEIDAYNKANKEIALQHKVHYIDITPWTREAATDHSLLAADGLHPSGKEYKRWAVKIAAWISKLV
ncbi:MAG: SGNH/GDSL hydrolase family protein [Chitinophagaceae bacterium]|jgi:lysophospholipase L1-like esterase|nr:SGNH/GDSL hydrolase family protein [Chitinophagaceae bacterium]